ncbi:arginine N-succinyltransferase [Cupriavidus basilensis]|uniref:Arginine N-succinyltransferase n=1 Tax=Cupriavidus basilensis TaxID=68895 RepID=A0ABT6ARI6_9BURK|nr:arginine N-succinyltransferase [Cupriavidus basilensis]MDF3835059.1 arginine N-succinyltransferase [Cupriavidus basilensis]
MWIARPAVEKDASALFALAQRATPHVHTLPRTRERIDDAVSRCAEALARSVDMPGDERYQMVLERPDGTLAGAASISATAGAAGAYFSYRNDVIHHVSRDLGISNNVHVLTLSSDLTAHSQLSGFLVDAPGEDAWAGPLLSRSRLMLAAADRRRFADEFFVCLAGQTRADHSSPFWDAIGRKFFNMDYLSAERVVQGARNGTLFVELMPHYPVYVSLLPDEAREVIGQLHPAATYPFDILSAEGFEAERYVDIFDGGPVLEAHASRLQTLATARTLTAGLDAGNQPAETCLVASTGPLATFRCTIASGVVELDRGRISLAARTLESLRVSPGDAVIVAAA